MAGIAASLEMSCVTAVFLLLGSLLCRLRFANSLCIFQLCSHGGLANPWKFQLDVAKIQWWNPGCLLIPARGASQTPSGCFQQWAGCRQVPWTLLGFGHLFSRAVWWLSWFQKHFLLSPIVSADKLLCFVWTIEWVVFDSL